MEVLMKANAQAFFDPRTFTVTALDTFEMMRERRDAELAAPKLLFQSVQLNLDAGRLPRAHANGVRHIALPLNFLRPADELGRPIASKESKS
jgi:hypothetical protein